MKSGQSLDHGPALPATDEKEREVQTMFSSIATRYDFNNSLLSMGLHHAWKKKAAQMVQVREGMAVLDLCAGTADIAIRLAEEVKRGV
jgi:demethylmenaquinone methyltransferase / 2-methoxy-6-polyprenyl-1,4-benzoquinol methylase